MKYVKTLNINNQTRLANFNPISIDKVKDFVTVNNANIHKINQEMNKLDKKSGMFKRRNETHYVVFHTDHDNDAFIDNLFDHGGWISYYTDSVVPYHVIKKMAKCSVSEAIYPLKKQYTNEEILNVQMTSQATLTALDLSVVVPDVDPYECLFSLFDLRYHIDRLKLSFPPLTEKEMKPIRNRYYKYSQEDHLFHLQTEAKFNFYNVIHNVLGKWKFNIWFAYENEEELDRLNHLVYPKKYKELEKEEAENNAK